MKPPGLLRARQLRLRIPGRVLVDGLDWQIRPGECWGLLGRNGSGKTTLLHSLAGLRQPQGGEIRLGYQGKLRRIDELPRRVVARKLSLLQQHTHYAFDARVLQMVLTGRHPHLGLWQRESHRDYAIARAALAAMELEDFAERNVSSLSGGESRRLAFATLLCQQTPLMLLDEPSNHLDIGHQIKIMRHLRQQVSAGDHAALIALHDINLASRYCSHILMLYGDGRCLAGPADEILGSRQLSELYQYPIEQLIWDQGRCFLPGTD